MELGTLIGLWTAVVLLTFIAIVVWAWSSHRKLRFEQAARIPLDDEDEAEVRHD
jgi:cytochrome c oxidase cbb3-type subunit 4